MNKKEISKEIALELDMNQSDVLVVINKFFENIVKNLSDGKEISISKFGKFKVKKGNKRTARNPKTGEKVFVDEKYKLSFKPSDNLKDYVNKVCNEKFNRK